MAELDKKDRIILYELDKNARQPLSKIAKKAGLSRESVLYRLRKYFSDSLLVNYITVINMAKLGFSHHKVFIKLHNINEEKERELVDYLCRSPYVTWVVNCDGKYSLIFGVKARDLSELNAFMKGLNNSFWSYIMEQDIASVIDAHHFYRDYLVGKQGATERKIQWGVEETEVKLGSDDIGVLDKLSENPRISAMDISKSLKIPLHSVLRRIKGLEKAGVIQHYMLWPNVTRLPGLYYKILISLHNLNPAKEKQLLGFCSQHPNIVYAVFTVGHWQLEIDVEAENLEQFRSILREFLNAFPEVVSDYSPLNVYKEYKFRFFEKGCLASR